MKKNSIKIIFSVIILINIWLPLVASATQHRSVGTSPINFANDSDDLPKNFGAPLKVMVDEDFEVKVFCLLPISYKENTIPVSQVSRCLSAHDEAQKILDKRKSKPPFVFWIESDGQIDYSSFTPSISIREIFASKGKLKIPSSFKESIENENKEIIKNGKENEAKIKSVDEDDSDDE